MGGDDRESGGKREAIARKENEEKALKLRRREKIVQGKVKAEGEDLIEANGIDSIWSNLKARKPLKREHE